MRSSTILFATDLQGDQGAGLQLATQLAADRGATLLILHVLPFRPADGLAMLHRAVDYLSSHPCDALFALSPSDPGIPFQHVLEAGDPEQRILEVARREEAELVVLEVRPRSRLRASLQRSMVERVVSACPCPVVTFRREEAPDGLARPRPPAAPGALAALEALQITLRARVNALDLSLTAWRTSVAAIASREDLRRKIADLHRVGSPGHGADRTSRLLALELGEQSRSMGAVGFQVVGPSGEVLLQDGATGCAVSVRDLLGRVRTHGPQVSSPLPSDRHGTDRARYVVLVGAPVRLSETERGMLVFSLDARRDFLRILGQPGPFASSETYAFDASGMMLSYSRFPEHLRAIGLLPMRAEGQIPLAVRVCDPGGNLLTGHRATLPVHQQPLTRMAAEATRGVSGFDNLGYRDYRGVQVIGAWQWLDRYGFGVAAEMDQAAS